MIVPPDQYYVRREPERDCDDYWAERRDPDGVLRDRLSTAEERQYIEDVAEELAFCRGLEPYTTLDVGCGPGWFLSALGGNGAGTEVCEIAAAEARRRGIVVEKTVGTFDYDSFDLVRCHHVIEHMEDPGFELDQMRRVCRRWLVISTPDFGSPCAVRFRSQYRMLHDQTHCSLFTNESMHRFLRDGGFHIHKVTYPFPQRFATAENMARWRDVVGAVSPPWPGNWMTFYCTVAK